MQTMTYRIIMIYISTNFCVTIQTYKHEQMYVVDKRQNNTIIREMGYQWCYYIWISSSTIYCCSRGLAKGAMHWGSSRSYGKICLEVTSHGSIRVNLLFSLYLLDKKNYVWICVFVWALQQTFESIWVWVTIFHAFNRKKVYKNKQFIVKPI